MKTEIETEHEQSWFYETDTFYGICIIAEEKMEIKFRFSQVGNHFYDVLKIDEAIGLKLVEPVSIEGMADHLHNLFPLMEVTAMGRADSHGWITSTVERVESL